MATVRRSNLDRVREIALALPETHEQITWDEPTLRVRTKIFCFPGEDSMTVKADPDEREVLLADPRFSLPHYVARFGWVSLRLPGEVDWDEVRELVVTSYCLIAPKGLAARVDR